MICVLFPFPPSISSDLSVASQPLRCGGDEIPTGGEKRNLQEEERADGLLCPAAGWSQRASEITRHAAR